MSELIYKDESYQIIGAAFEVYNEQGCGFPEPICQESMEIELELRDIPFKAQPRMQISYKGRLLKKRFIPDFLAYDKIIVELKVLDVLTDKERKQVYHYLKASELRLGLLINFGNPDKLEWERIVWSPDKPRKEYEF